MNENSVELASLVRFTVVDTLKKSAPGISETVRDAIANSIMIKLRAQAPSAFPSAVTLHVRQP